jgi:hypothetical protein
MEHGLGEDFHRVTLSVREGAGGPVAYTVGEHIVISARWYRPDTWLGRFVLAHELAHVVQKRRGSSSAVGSCAEPCPDAVEAEAHTAAVAVTSDGRFACALADRSESRRFWGFAGHYYTVYFILLAAGIEDEVAARMALYAQLPDLVAELDATRAGLRYVLDPTVPVWSSLGVTQLQIQIGLHALSGRPSSEETKSRSVRLRAAHLNTFEFGLAIHPYGDSFAHRRLDDDTRMYNAPLGHFVEVRHLAPHDPDFIDHPKRRQHYHDYALGLYGIASRKANLATPLLEKDALRERLDEIASEQGDEAQSEKIREIAERDRCPLRSSFRPEEEPLCGWADFVKKYPTRVPADSLVNAWTYAKAWTSPLALQDASLVPITSPWPSEE